MRLKTMFANKNTHCWRWIGNDKFKYRVCFV